VIRRAKHTSIILSIEKLKKKYMKNTKKLPTTPTTTQNTWKYKNTLK
jgi:hypothetical protein